MQFRKLAAIGGSALMGLLSIAGPALASSVTALKDVSNMVSVTGTTANFPVFVVGASAQPADVVGSINVATKFASFAKTTTNVSVSGGGAAGADGATFRTEISWFTNQTKDFDLTSGSDFVLNPVARGGRTATFLKAGSVYLNTTEYKYYEQVGASTLDNPGTWWRLEYDSAGTGSFETQYLNLGVNVPANDVWYALKFETPVPSAGLIGKKVTWWGKDYVVTAVTPGTGTNITEMKLSATGGLKTIAQGASDSFGDYTVEVIYVGRESSVTKADLKVSDKNGNADEQIIAVGTTASFNVGGAQVPVYLDSALEGQSARLLIGATSLTIKPGALDSPYGDWTATLYSVAATGYLSNITLAYNKARSGFTGPTQDLTKNTSLSGPDNFFSVTYAGLETRDYVTIDFLPIVADLNSSTSALESGIQLTASEQAFDVGGGVFAKNVAFDTETTNQTPTTVNGNWSYMNSTNGWTKMGSSRPQITVPDGVWTFKAGNFSAIEAVAPMIVVNITGPALTESAGTNWTWYIEYQDPGVNAGVGRFGNVTELYGVAGSAAGVGSYYVSYGNGSLAYALAHNDSTPKSRVGFVAKDGSQLTGASTSALQLKIPKGQVYGDLIFGKPAGTGPGGSVVQTQTIIPIGTPVAYLDTQLSASDKTSKDLVLVGGPCVNTLVAELATAGKFPYACNSWPGADFAVIKVVSDAFATGYSALVIAGTRAADTSFGTQVVQDGTYLGTQTGDTAKLTVSSVTTPTAYTG